MNVILMLSHHRHVSLNDVVAHLQGEIIITIAMCLDQSTVKSRVILLKFTVKGLSYRWI